MVKEKLSRWETITEEGLGLQKENKQTMEWVKIKVNIVSCPHEFLKSYLTVEGKIITFFGAQYM